MQDITFVIFDTETTGLNEETDRVIEVGAVKVINGQVVDRFSRLINPKRHIPYSITRLTGISTAMLVNEADAETVLLDFLSFIEDAVLVAHNLAFDEKFLLAELERNELPEPENPRLCTLRLARRILPKLPSRSLKSLCDYYGIRIVNHHRAEADAEATALILQKLFEYLKNEQQVNSIEDLVRFQYRSYAQTKGEPKHIQHIREHILPQLPDCAGVYKMLDRHKRLIYVGKAKRLKNRVQSYFRAIEAHPKKTQNLVREVRYINWEETPSELDALILESQLIKKHLPKFNRALLRYKNVPFIRLNAAEAFPKASWVYRIQDDAAEYFGPLRNREQAEQTLELINHLFLLRECDEATFNRKVTCIYHEMKRCEAPCVKPEAKERYAQHIENVRAFLKGSGAQILTSIEVKMKEAAAKLAFEEARWFRDQLRMFERIVEGRRAIAAPIRDHNGVIYVPDEAVFHIIRFGKLASTWTKGSRDALKQVIQAQFNPDAIPPSSYSQQEIDEIRVLGQWMYANRGHFRQVAWDANAAEANVDANVDALLDELLLTNQAN